MSAVEYESAFQSPYVAALIGVAVSLDVIALTFCSDRIYSEKSAVWRRWAKYNACWHAGLLLVYLVAIDCMAVLMQYLGLFVSFSLPEWLKSLEPIWQWIAEKFQSHVVVYAAIGAMAYVWRQYSYKVVAVPTDPNVNDAPFFVKPVFKRFSKSSIDQNSPIFWHLSACLVAVDMLALAAVVKSGEKLIQFPQGIKFAASDLSSINDSIINSFNYEFLFATATVTIFVFSIVGLLCYLSAYVSNVFWKRMSDINHPENAEVTAIFVVVTLRLLEPMVIFYFIIHSMAFLATGVPIHNPAFLLGSAFLVAALIQYVGFSEILKSSRMQVTSGPAAADGGRQDA